MHNYASYCSSSSSSSSPSGSSSTGSPAMAGFNPSLHVTVEPLSEAYEGISLLSLSRTDARNAIGRQLLRELSEAVNTLRQERSTRCVVLRSTVPGVFSAGADLKERASMTQAETKEFVNRLRRVFDEVHALPMPVVAVIEGFALGGGAELALAADIRVASDDAVFAFPEAQLGIIPGAGGTQRLPRLVGASRAKDLIFTGGCSRAGSAGTSTTFPVLSLPTATGHPSQHEVPTSSLALRNTLSLQLAHPAGSSTAGSWQQQQHSRQQQQHSSAGFRRVLPRAPREASSQAATPCPSDVAVAARQETVAAGEALDMGLVDHRVPTPQAYDKALHIASSIARCAPLALRMSKVAINQGLDMDLTTGLHWEEMCYAQLLPSKDRLEGLAAFAEKRKPMFNGE
ncbi:hypothetical protein QJQ45_010910 [Haematococcus lacustris]|nr:hypothetical protein QJQ45_010910 [Haematococcus lacustris]